MLFIKFLSSCHNDETITIFQRRQPHNIFKVRDHTETVIRAENAPKQVHQQARESMTALMDYIRVTTTRLNVEVDGLDSLRYVMNVLKEVGAGNTRDKTVREMRIICVHLGGHL